MRNKDHRLVPGSLQHSPVQLVFRYRVQVGRGLIQDHKGAVLVECPRHRHLLALAAGKHQSVIVKLPQQLGVHSPGQRSLKAAVVQRTAHPLRVKLRTERHILPYPTGKQLEVLEHRRKPIPMALQGAVPNVLPINQDPPTGGLIQPQQQIG